MKYWPVPAEVARNSALTLKERALVVLLLTVLASGFFSHFMFGFSHRDRSGHAFGNDDAFITYRYAQNFAEGRGLALSGLWR